MESCKKTKKKDKRELGEEMTNNKILEKIKKLSYIFEFIISVLMAISVFNLLEIKAECGYFDKIWLIFSGITVLIDIIIIIYNIYKDKKSIEKMFLNVVIPIGILFWIFMIPGQVPDEEAHMIKAYEVSNGILYTKRDENGESKTIVPQDLLEYNHNKMNNYIKLKEQLNQKTDYLKTVETVSSAQGYTWILYIVPASIMFIARNINLNLLVAIYIARLMNFVVFIILGYYTIKKIPFGKIVTAIYLLMPMMLQQANSCSADVIVNAISLYIISYILYLLFKENRIETKEMIIYCILVIILAVAKYVYIPLIGIGLLLIFKKNLTKKQKMIFITVSIVLGLVFSIISYIFASKYTSTTESMRLYYEEYNVNGAEQIKSIIQSPLNMIKIIKNDWINNLEQYIYMCVGSELAWLDVKPTRILISLYIITLLAATILEKNQYSLKKIEKLWVLMITIGIVGLVQLAMYISFTPLGANFIGGVQGRYFIPVFILPLLCISMKNNYIKSKNPNIILPCIVGIINIFVIKCIFIAYI